MTDTHAVAENMKKTQLLKQMVKLFLVKVLIYTAICCIDLLISMRYKNEGPRLNYSMS